LRWHPSVNGSSDVLSREQFPTERTPSQPLVGMTAVSR
jgi:hypothetical protein